jgi:hypothetical protein
MKLFKTRKAVKDVVLIYLDDLIEEAIIDFVDFSKNLNDLNCKIIITEEIAKWNFIYSRISLEMVKLRKYFKESEINEIVIYLFWFLVNDLGDSSKNQIDKYYTAFAEAIKKGDKSPFDALSKSLLSDLLGDDFDKFSVNLSVTNLISPILIQITTIGLITYKVSCEQMKDDYKIVFHS